MIESAVKQSIKNACQEVFSWQPADIELVNPDPQFGDFALACHSFAAELKLAPQAIAEKLRSSVKSEIITKAEAVAGYLNITVAISRLGSEVLSEVIQTDKHYGWQKPTGEKIVLEYLSPNTNKPLHLGHARNSFLGMAIANLLEAVGGTVIKVDIINDRGIHIMKSLVAYQKLGGGKTPEEEGVKSDHFVGDYYVKFNEETMMDDAREALRQWEAGDKETIAQWKLMNKWALTGINTTARVLGADFQKEYFESDTYKLGNKIVDEGVKKGVFYQAEDGSVWVDLEDVGLDKKIVRRADGTSVYVTQDLGLAVTRQKEWRSDAMIYVVGHEQEYHFKVLFAILKKLGYKWADKLRHLSYGLVFLPEGKMKSRAGQVVDADNIIAEVKNLAALEIKKRTSGILESDLNERASAIGLGALKFFLLRVTPTQSIHYNPAEAIAFEGATGPYVQYAHARIASILKEETALPPDRVDFSKLTQPEEKILLLKLLFYPKIVAQAAANFSPNSVCDYLVNLAHAFNTFYHQHQVLRAVDDDTKHARLLLIKAVQIVLRNGLAILGIKAPEKM